jgi:integrase
VPADIARETCGRLALEAFAGLRFSMASQIAPADIDRAAKGISLPAAKHKARKRDYVEGFTPNLWAWLEWSKVDEWKMTPRQYLEAKSSAFDRGDGVPHPRNVLRHSFASYDVAAHGDVGKTATRLSHASPKMLYRHYKGKATQADGVAYFQILPPSP